MSRLRNSSSFTLTVVKRKKTFQNELFIALIFAVQNTVVIFSKINLPTSMTDTQH